MQYGLHFEPKMRTAVIYGECSSSMPIDEMAKTYQTYRSGVSMIIYTRSQGRSRERNEVPGCKFRKVFGTGKVIHSDAWEVAVL